MGRFYPAYLVLALLAGMGLGAFIAHRRPASPPEGAAALAATSSVTREYLRVLQGSLPELNGLLHPGPGGTYYAGPGASDPASIRQSTGALLACAVLADESSLASSPASGAYRAAGGTHLAASPSGGAAGQLVHSAARVARRLIRGETVQARATVPFAWLTAGERSRQRARAIGLIRFLTRSHRIGSAAAMDGRKWGGSDSSPADAAALGLAAYLLRPSLDSQLWSQVSDVVHFEAQRFLLQAPASGASGDSAAVANASAAEILCVAGNLFTTGGTANAYQRRAIDYLRAVLTTYSDVNHASIPAPTLFPDLALQWNGAFSPAAELQVLATLGRCELSYRLADRTPPPDLRRHVHDVWRRLLLVLSLPEGWFIAGSGGVTDGGAGVSWLAAGLDDPAARFCDAQSAHRIRTYPELDGASAETPLRFARPADLAERVLLYAHLSGASSAGEPTLTLPALSRSLIGVHWYGSAGLLVHRTEDSVLGFSWTAGVGQLWELQDNQHIRWRFQPGREPAPPAAEPLLPPTINQPRNGVAALGPLRLENGAEVQAGVYSIAGGPLLLIEAEPSGASLAQLNFARAVTPAEPDVYRDDEADTRGGARWINIDNALGMTLLQGRFSSLSPPGVSRSDARRPVWPLASVDAGGASTLVVAIYPRQGWRDTQDFAADSQPLRCANPGWAGAVLSSDRESQLVIGHLAGAGSTSVAASCPYGGPVTAEPDSVSNSVSTFNITVPRGCVHQEPISCWLNVDNGQSVRAHQGKAPGSVVVLNRSQQGFNVRAHYVATGQPCQVVTEDGKEIVRLPARRDEGEVRFFIGPGRTLTLKY